MPVFFLDHSGFPQVCGGPCGERTVPNVAGCNGLDDFETFITVIDTKHNVHFTCIFRIRPLSFVVQKGFAGGTHRFWEGLL